MTDDDLARQERRVDDLPQPLDAELPVLGGPWCDPDIAAVAWNDHAGAFVTLELSLGGDEPIRFTLDALDAAQFAEAVDDAAAAAEAFADEWAENQVDDPDIRAKEIAND